MSAMDCGWALAASPAKPLGFPRALRCRWTPLLGYIACLIEAQALSLGHRWRAWSGTSPTVPSGDLGALGAGAALKRLGLRAWNAGTMAPTKKELGLVSTSWVTRARPDLGASEALRRTNATKVSPASANVTANSCRSAARRVPPRPRAATRTVRLSSAALFGGRSGKPGAAQGDAEGSGSSLGPLAAQQSAGALRSRGAWGPRPPRHAGARVTGPQSEAAQPPRPHPPSAAHASLPRSTPW
jgi:hypothetical protein